MNGIVRPSKRTRTLFLLLLFGLALVIRAGRALQLPLVAPDTIRYIEQAQLLPLDPLKAVRTEVYHPLHSIAILGVHKIFTVLGMTDGRQLWVNAALAVGIFCGSLMAVLIVLLARRFGAPFWPAMGAGFFWIVNRRTSAYGGDAISDMLALCCFTGSMLAAMTAMHFRTSSLSARQARAFLLSGLLAGFAYLTRPEGLAAPLIVIATLAAWWLIRTIAPTFRATGPFKLLPRHRPALLPLTTGIVLLVAPLLLVALPYMLAIGGITHKKQLLPSAAAAPSVQIFAGAPSVSRLEPTWQTAAVEKPTARWVLTEVCKTLGYGPMAILLLPILWHRRLWGRPRFRLLVFAWAALWYVVMFWLLLSARYLDGRHTLPLVVLGMALVGVALPLWTWPMKRWMALWKNAHVPAWTRRPHWPRTFVAAIYVSVVIASLIELRTPMWWERAVVSDATAWVKANVRPGIVICDKQRLVGYYSGHPYAFWDLPANAAPPTDAVRRIQAQYACDVVLLGKLFERDEEPIPATGDYREVMRFGGTGPGLWGNVYILYARPGDPWRVDSTDVHSPNHTPPSDGGGGVR